MKREKKEGDWGEKRRLVKLKSNSHALKTRSHDKSRLKPVETHLLFYFVSLKGMQGTTQNGDLEQPHKPTTPRGTARNDTSSNQIGELVDKQKLRGLMRNLYLNLSSALDNCFTGQFSRIIMYDDKQNKEREQYFQIKKFTCSLTFANFSPFSVGITVLPSSAYDSRKSVLLPHSIMGMGFDVLSCKKEEKLLIDNTKIQKNIHDKRQFFRLKLLPIYAIFLSQLVSQ